MKNITFLKNPLITGTLLLSGAGISSRFMGFFFRIFLSRSIGAEGLGLYQLVIPIISLTFAITASGFQTAISKFVAESKQKAAGYFISALILSCLLALFISFIVYKNSIWIAIYIFGNVDCYSLIQVASYSILPATFHACVNGFYFGKKKATIPSISQLIEQVVRIGSVYIMYMILSSKNEPLLPIHAMWGIVLSEAAGMLYCLTVLCFNKSRTYISFKGCIRLVPSICTITIPITLNHLLINICTAAENILIPRQLELFGHSTTDALKLYGILTGITLPIIFFPGVITNSLSVLLLPKISEDNSVASASRVSHTAKKAIRYGLLLGFSFTIIFLLLGNFIGEYVFKSYDASAFICKLCWLCPFLYTNSLLGSILHGLGRPGYVLLTNILSSAIRIFMIISLIPKYGIDALLWGMLISQIFSFIAMTYNLKYHSSN